MTQVLPLSGVTVLDVSRMLPGGILVRHLVDMGARVIKVEDPAGGDPMRHMPPAVDGIGCGFRTLFRGTESVALDLRSADGAAALLKLSRHADVFVESFRPGTLEKWGLSIDRMRSVNPTLISVSLSGFGSKGPLAGLVGHDINFMAMTGALAATNPDGLPLLQLADVSAGLLALSAVLAGLLVRTRTGRGMHFDQPLVAGPMPFLIWNMASASLPGEHMLESLLGGHASVYRRYRCADGVEIATGALEPKFSASFMEMVGLTELTGDALDTAERGETAARAVAARIEEKPSEVWLSLSRERGLPVTVVHTCKTALTDPDLQAIGFFEEDAAGGSLRAPASPFEPFRRKLRGAPRLGADTEKIAREFGLEIEEIH